MPSESPRSAEVAPGIWSLLIPYPTPLGHVYSYALDVGDGIVLVDAGWDSDAAWTAFRDGLSSIGARLTDIRALVVTHIHPDHYGLASRIRECTDAWIGMHAAEAARIPADGQEGAVIDGIATWLSRAGAPESAIADLHAEAARILKHWPSVVPDRILTDGEVLDRNWGITAIATPGHTPGHLCFSNARRGVVFTGDHVLPRISPNIAKRPGATADPLGDFVKSLARVRQLGDVVGLPGHEWPIRDLTSRIDDLNTHHSARMLEIEEAVRRGTTTAWEVATVMSWSKPWSALPPDAKRSALGETLAHLVRLVREGRLDHLEGPLDRWSPRRGAPHGQRRAGPSQDGTRPNTDLARLERVCPSEL